MSNIHSMNEFTGKKSNNAFQGTARTLDGKKIPPKTEEPLNPEPTEEPLPNNFSYESTVMTADDIIPAELNGHFWTLEIDDPLNVSCQQHCLYAYCPCCSGGCCSEIHKREWLKLLTMFSFWVSIIQIGLYLASLCFTPSDEIGISLSPSTEALLTFGANNRKDIKAGKIYVLITYIFLHGSIWHILLNLLTQLTYSLSFESAWGSIIYILIYFVTGIIGGLFSSCRPGYNVSVGSSSALFGILGTMLILWIIFCQRLSKVAKTIGGVQILLAFA